MERITITIDTGNAAFDDTPATEIGRILREIAENFESFGVGGGDILDVNGNVCGNVNIARQ